MSSVKKRVDAISNNIGLTINTPITSCKIELTGICTLACTFCDNHIMKQNNQRQKLLSDDEFNNIIHFLQHIPTLHEVGLFYMGESSLHPHLYKFARKLKDLNYFTYLTTNATTIKHTLKALPWIDSLKVSYNYKHLNDFKFKTKMPEQTFDTINHNIHTLYKACHCANKQLAISTVLDSKKEDYAYIKDFLPCDEHYFIPLQNQGGTFSTGLSGVVGEEDCKRAPIPCWSLFKCIYIDCDLNVRACTYGHTDKHIIGNIKNDNIATILNNKQKLKQIHLEHRIPNACKYCLLQ